MGLMSNAQYDRTWGYNGVGAYSVHLLSTLYLHVGVKISKLSALFFNFVPLIFADVKDFAGVTSVLAGVSCAYKLLFRVSGYKALFSDVSSISGFP
jgi:hypothetical protein